ncbi:MAG: calcium/sodium antiporter, partial [Woeseiaceae bacterium]
LLGGAALVGGASQLAARLGVPPMVVGLTIVGFGTSAPELVVNIVGGLRGESALAFGNVVGSNISNLALVLGAAAILQKIEIHGRVIRRELALLLLVTTIMTVMALDKAFGGGVAQIDQSDAVVLLLLFAIFVHITAQDMRLARQSDALFDEVADYPLVKSGAKRRFLWAYIVAGFVLLFIGGELTVRYASAFAVHVGLSTTVIGLFVVAVGTSLPELVTSVMAAWRRESDLALGNILGSNVFNSLIVLPVSALIDNVAIPEGGVQDLIVSWVLAAVLVPIFYFGNQSLGRISGSLLVIAYFTYAIIRITA